MHNISQDGPGNGEEREEEEHNLSATKFDIVDIYTYYMTYALKYTIYPILNLVLYS